MTTLTRKQAYDRKRYAENREQLNARQRAYYAENREARLAYIRDYSAKKQVEKREFIAELKSHPCHDCGGKFHACAMDFDHLEGESKIDSISTLMRNMRVTLKRLKEEVAKCELVCANCHRVRTYNRMMEKANVET